MSFGSPEFVLIIIGMAMLSGVLKSWGGHGRRHRREVEASGSARDAEWRSSAETLRLENARLREKLEAHERRLVSLERIVTDSGYDVARQIEQLRDSTPLPTINRDRTPA